MSKEKSNPQTQDIFLKLQEAAKRVKKRQEEQAKLLQAQKSSLIPEPRQSNSIEINPSSVQKTPSFSEDKIKKIVQSIDIDRPPQTWTSTLTNQNISVFYEMINKFSQNLNKSIWQKFTAQPLRLNPYSLSSEQLIDKNRPIVDSRKGTFLFSDLVTKLYFTSLPSNFQIQFKEHLDQNQKIFNGFFGWWIFTLVYIKINRKKEWSWVSRINNVWAKSLVLFVGSFFCMNRYFQWSDSQFARKNVDILQTCLDTHLRLLQAHGIHLDQSFSKFIEQQKHH